MIEKTIAGLKIGDAQPVRIMGVINLSRESFYKGSVVQADSILDAALRMIDEGADLIDVGARSTWPQARRISKEEERLHLIPAIKHLSDIRVPISVDTMFSDIADEALDAGADIINDVSGFTADTAMADVAEKYSCPVILMASNKLPGDPAGMDAVMDSLGRIISHAEGKGVDPDNIIIDPAIGRWTAQKLPMYDYETIDNLKRLRVFEKPILAAISRKSFIGDVLNKPASERLYGSLAATAIAVRNGAHIIRTHDVAPTVDAVKVAQAARARIPAVRSDDFEAELLYIKDQDDSERAMRSIGVTGSGSHVMKNKTVLYNILLRNVTTTEALIIKQEMLARGGDAALPRGAVSHEVDKVNLIIIGTRLQIERLIKKIKHQVRNLPLIADMLAELIYKKDDTIFRYSR
ncbi:Dihydropteroate synthase [Candidatus Methanoperedens nitroreducens]|uniref:dihydropteroate synthase n=1 Tax=Candidatus Methanoperedens nitratireducens TaxID=1392998 RepID=A0A062V3S3_9EURY|nr:dihydropteroate synthase [Candidatus Methanoperedens nitroreducens]KCZ71977.1 Dihydropteroate synthase [Candidatus Methanoperedens nitroreducens]MDJ1422046.1 dihydropteroate synthase [Candidatus Methanoperedens sp.]